MDEHMRAVLGFLLFFVACGAMAWMVEPKRKCRKYGEIKAGSVLKPAFIKHNDNKQNTYDELDGGGVGFGMVAAMFILAAMVFFAWFVQG